MKPWPTVRLGEVLRRVEAYQERRPVLDGCEYREALRYMLKSGNDVVADIPEHFRGYALRRLMRLPWRYWRYPRGANSTARPFAYSSPDGAGALQACEPELQIKSGGLSRPPGTAPDPKVTAEGRNAAPARQDDAPPR